ncbi:hypothetical protein EON76_02930 [bacterium]|nr:MAG: hypothetical protein EON76_02930 [bacterium]
MARLPQPGGDNGNWGTILNDYLAQSHKSDGTIKANTIGSSQLQDNAVTATSLAPNSITNAALASNSVTASALADGSITNAKLAVDSVAKTQLQPSLRTEIDSKLAKSSADTSYAPISLVDDAAKKYGPAVRPQVMALLGDSITNQCSGTQTVSSSIQNFYTMASWWDHANALLGNRFQTVWASPTEREFGGSGKTSAQLLSEGHVDAAVASGASWCHLLIGTNDIAQGVDATVTLDNIKKIQQKFLSVGMTLIVATVLPRSDSVSLGLLVDPINTLIRKWAPSTQGVILNDWAPAMQDPTTGAAYSIYFRDGVHPNGSGGQRMGYTLAQLLAPATAPIGIGLDRSSLLGVNGLQLGIGGFKSGAGGAGVTGDVSANNTCYADASANAVASKVTRTDLLPGAWQQYVITGTPSISHSSRISDPSKWATGELVYGVAEYQIDTSAWQAKNLTLTLMCLPGTATQSVARSPFGDTVASLPTVDGSLLSTGILVTPPMQITASQTALRLDGSSGGGNHTIRWGRMQILKV